MKDNSCQEIPNKSFNSSLHKGYDIPARKAMLKFLYSKGAEAIENPNKYDVDIVDIKKNRGYELERRTKWTDGEYPYFMVNLLKRKCHLFNGEHEMSNIYVIFNNDCTQFIYIPQGTIQEYLTDENIYLENCFVPSEGWRKDWVYKIPRERFKTVCISN